MAAVWWWVVSPAETGAASRPRDARLISTPDSGPEYDALAGGGSYKGAARYQGPFATRAAAQAASPGGGSLAEQIAAGVQAGAANDAGVVGSGARAAQAASNGLGGLAAIGDFFGRLTEAVTWLRAAKILAGGALLIIGIAHITGAGNALASTARKVPLPV